MITTRDIAASLDERLWSTDLFLPRYRAGEIGVWRINPGGQLVHDRGYYTGPCLLEMLPWLARKVESRGNADGDGWQTWMSLTPHEIESQELACRFAFGHTVVMGLGMGWVAANVALNAKVTKVSIIERDPDVIELFAKAGALESLPQAAQRKIAIIEADALEWTPSVTESVDFLYADIWLQLADPSTLGQVRQMQAKLQAEKIYYWGQEIAIHCAARQCVENNSKITAAALKRAVERIMQLPLLVPDDRDYLEMIERVIENRTIRGLTVELDLT